MNAPDPRAFPSPALCLVTDHAFGQGQALLEKVVAAVEGGVNLVQLREKDLPGGQLLALANGIREVTREKALLLVNDRVDVALGCGADGVQLGEEALPIETVRRISGRRLLIGRSVHSVQSAQEAEAEGADFLVVGTIFPTTSKPGAEPAGLVLLRQVAGSVNIPFLAIGGVTSANVAGVMDAGAAGAAVISGLLAPSDTRRAAVELREAMMAATANSGVVSSR